MLLKGYFVGNTFYKMICYLFIYFILFFFLL
jgi:hypothetical protein